MYLQQTEVNNLSENLYTKIIDKFLKGIEYGAICLRYKNQEYIYGNLNNYTCTNIDVLHDNFFKFVFWRGDLGFAESYMLGYWVTDDLTKLLRIIGRNYQLIQNMDQSIFAVFNRFAVKLLHWFSPNSIKGARKNISRHYDLGNDFFALFLDPTMMYSAGYHVNNTLSLDYAVQEKYALICEKLQLSSADHVLEIGCGWGGFALYAAKKYGCRITAITISQQQFAYCKDLVIHENIDHLIKIELCDYRNITGKYDKLVSIEMIEAVGAEYLTNYLRCCSKLLNSKGLFLLQVISISENRYRSALKNVDFIKHYIFPGCFIPALSEILGRLRKNTDLNVVHMQDLTYDYSLTLKLWRENFAKNMEKIINIFGVEFYLKWIYYFSYCEAGFAERLIYDHQILLAKPEYIYD